MSTALTVDVQVACDDAVPADADIQEWVSAAYGRSGRVVNRPCEIAVRIVDAEEIKTLNELYRKKNGATNVLSFPGGDMLGLPDDATRMLGDIVICASVVASEAIDQGKDSMDHWAHMLVHGTLHLLGFDHNTDTEAAEMEALEASILATGDISNPYQRS